MAKVCFDLPLNMGKTFVAWPKGFIDGFWIALKGEAEDIQSIWTFFTDDFYGRAAAACAAVNQTVNLIKTTPKDELLQMLKEMPENLGITSIPLLRRLCRGTCQRQPES